MVSSHCCPYGLTLLASFSMHAFLKSIIRLINALVNISNRLKGFIIIAQRLGFTPQNKIFNANLRSWRLPIVPSHVNPLTSFLKMWVLILQGQWEKPCYFVSLLSGKVWTYFKRAYLLDQDRLITVLIFSSQPNRDLNNICKIIHLCHVLGVRSKSPIPPTLEKVFIQTCG